MDLHFSPRQVELIELVAALGRDRFAPRAAAHDRDAVFPRDNYDDLRRAGLLELCVPRSHGGMGVDLATYALVAAEMGRYCGATALTFNMHSMAMMYSGRLADTLDMSDEERARHGERRAEHFRRVVENGAIWSQPFSEGNASNVGAAPFGVKAVAVDGGWLVSGRKIFASLAGAADYYGVLVTEHRSDSEPRRRDTLYLAIHKDTPGLRIVGDWDPLGMRATSSYDLVFDQCFVPDSEQLLPRGLYMHMVRRWPHVFMTLCPSYMGIARAAYDFTVRYLRGEVPGIPPVVRRMYPTKQIAVARMRIALEQAEALFLRAFAEARPDPDKGERLRILAAQYTVMEHCNDICRLAIRTCGGQSIRRALPLERYYRDSRCGSLMLPLTAEICLDRLGKESLYEPGESDEIAD
ncbi:MAG: acyl-CoA/acyl-ACP dehydrogenase [Proteobacteria bacterium]|nr:acyl-CoA/acyl-ACP dehydrogenase [Pseudomonadota bacterium]